MKSYPLLQSQLGVFYDCLKYPQVMQYNNPCIVPLTADIDCDLVEAAMQTISTASLLPASRCGRWRRKSFRRRWSG